MKHFATCVCRVLSRAKSSIMTPIYLSIYRRAVEPFTCAHCSRHTLRTLFTVLFVVCIGVANVWAETVTIVSWKNQSLAKNTAVAADDGDANNKSKATISSSVALTTKGTNAYYASNGGGTKIQFSNLNLSGYTDISMTFYSRGSKTGAITTSAGTASITVTKSEKQYTISNIPNTTTSLTLTYGATSGSFYFGTVVISGTESATSSCTKPTFTIENKTISLAEASAANYDLSALTTNKGGSTGAITYACDDASVMIDGSTFYTETPGTYTITATMAADETYCEATTTFTITVPCTRLATPTGMNASATAYNAATLTWTAVENATKYQVTITPNGGTAKTAEATGTTYNATDLTPETTYTWTVKAIGNGTTYCDSEESAESTFTTPAKPKYTITWSTPASTSTTQVTQGDKVILPTTNPEAPQGCSDKVFMGWSATNIGTTGTDNAPDFITAETVPAGDVTYYAVFATASKSTTGVSGSLEITISNFTEITASYAKVFTHTYTDATVEAKGVYKNSSGIQMNSGKGTYIKNTTALPGPITNITCTWSATGKNSPTLYVAKGGVASTSSTNLGKQSNTSKTQSVDVSASEGYDYFYFDGTTVTGACYLTSLKITYGGASTTYTDYVTNCVECTNPTTPLVLSVAETTLNLGEAGTAATTFATIGGNGGTIDYVVNPTAGATLDKDNKKITFNAAGTYTLTASQDLNTTDGTTYCGSRDSKTITVTSTPVLYFTTTPADPIEFPEVECGGNTPLSQKQQISLQGYNLTGDVSVAVIGDYKIARTASAALGDYTTELTLPKTTAGKINATYSSVYVISCPPAQNSSTTNGTLTITSANGNTLTVNLSTSTVTCKEYTLTLNDRGSKSDGGTYYARASVPQPADPIGVCTEPINYVFDGWATEEVANGSAAYTPVSFPYTMPKGNTTLYAVYRYVEEKNNDFQIADADVDLEDGKDCILTAQSSSVEYALSSVASTDVVGKMTTKEVAVDEDEAVAYKIQDVTDNTIIWTLEGNATDGYSFLNKETRTYLTAVNGTLSMGASANTKYTISHPDPTKWSVEVQKKGSSNYLSGYEPGEVLFSDYRSSTLNLYLYVRAYSYTTSPICEPYIKATGDIAITSGKGIWVESITPLTISAKNLDKNEDGAAVTITATVTDDAAAKGFTIKTPGTQNSGAKIVTFETNHTGVTFDGVLTVVYTPTKDSVIDEGEIVLRVTRYNGTTEYATASIKIHGRSLPTKFVLAAQTADDGWVALPSDLEIGSEAVLKTPCPIIVDDVNNPTKATEAPKTAIWYADARSAKNTAPTAIRLKNANNQYLQGATIEDNIWLSISGDAQPWELKSEDFTDYHVRIPDTGTERYLSYDLAQGKIGNYKQVGTLRILPAKESISVTGITVSPTAVNLRAGQSQELTIDVTPKDAFNSGVQWHSSNATVATVSVTAEGTFVHAHSEGSAILTATTQDGSNLTATVNATITAANTYTYIDALHGNATQVHAGKHTVPAFSNQREGEGMECTYLHYHFIGWTKSIINSDTDKAPTDLLKPGETVDANKDSTPQTYYAVWAEATTK